MLPGTAPMHLIQLLRQLLRDRLAQLLTAGPLLLPLTAQIRELSL